MRQAVTVLFLTAIAWAQATLSAQDFYAPRERFRFARETFAREQYAIAKMESEQLLMLGAGLPEDSLHFIAGMSLMRTGQRRAALPHLLLMRRGTSDLAVWGHAAMAWESFRKGDSLLSTKSADAMRSGGNRMSGHADLLMLGHELKSLDTSSYWRMRDSLEVTDAHLGASMRRMDSLALSYEKRHRRSPAVAGVLAAALPGSGKCYLGRWASGGMTLVGHAMLGVQAWEGYRKGGVRSPQFIGMGALLLLSYSVNIYGTIVQTKTYNVQIVTDLQRGVGLEVDLAFGRLFQ